MEVPLDVVEEIIGHLPPLNNEWLRNCSLVTKSWIRPSQQRIFEVVDIRPQNLRSWLRNISPANIVLLEHVRELSYGESPKRVIPPAYYALRDYLPSFRQLRRLTLVYAHIPSYPDHIEALSAFQHTVSAISLSSCNTTKGALLTLINYFPNLACLQLSGLGYIQEEGPMLPLSRTVFKTLYAIARPTGTLDPLEELSKLGLRFEEVAVTNFLREPTWPYFSKRVVGIFGESVKFLKIYGAPGDGPYPLTLSDCRELRELEVNTMGLNDAELRLISSITSTSIEKITLNHSPAFKLPVGDPYWARLDAVLTKLAERSKYMLGLEVAFWYFEGVWDEESDLAEYLPKFAEKGRMTVLSNNREVLYTSDDVWKRR